MITIPDFILVGILGGQEIVIILIIVLVLFGGKKIPELMRGLGKGMKEFKDVTNDITSDIMDDKSASNSSKK